MSGVVLRCPSCGTTRAAPGECEACHEAQVRYFCTNHTPGRWLEAPACPQCGARFGAAARPPAAAPPPAPAPTSAPAAPAPTSAPRRAGVAAWRRKVGGGPWSRREGPPSLDEVFDAHDEGAAVARGASAARLRELVRAASRVRRTPGGGAHAPEAPAAAGPGLGGCLARALFLAVFLAMAFVTLSLVAGGSLLQIIGLYY